MPAVDRSVVDERRDLLLWLAAVGVGLLLAVVLLVAGARVGVDSPPFEGEARLTPDGALLLAPVAAALVLWPALRGAHERLPWPALLLLSWLAALAWTLALAATDGTERLERQVTGAEGFLADATLVRADPLRFLEGYVAGSEQLSAASQQRPPGPALLLAALDAAGLGSPGSLLLVFAVLGTLVLPLFAVAVRGLCHEPTARRLLPVLALAPYAVWVSVSVDACTALLVAAALALATFGSRPGGSPWWAGVAGLLTGLAALMSYAAAWLGISVLAVFFVRRRPLLPIWGGVGALLPLVVLRVLGFGYLDGLEAARRADDIEQAQRSPLVWALLAVVLVALCCGPALVPSLRRVLNTPGWPFLVGAGLGIGFALLLGLARGGLEHAWLPFFPWLLVAAVAPVPRTADPDPTPLRLVAVGAVTGAVLAAVVH